MQTLSSFEDALYAVELEIKSIFGFGLGNEVNFLTTRPILTQETDTAEKQHEAWSIRTINEATASLIFQLQQKISNSNSIDTLLNDIVDDLDDGLINAASGDLTFSYSESDISIFSQNIQSLTLAGHDEVFVKDMDSIIANETSFTGNSDVDVSLLSNANLKLTYNSLFLSTDVDEDGIVNSVDIDNDNDGIEDDIDVFPLDSNEWVDNDLDNIGDNEDLDDDNDGTPDELDAFPLTQLRLLILIWMGLEIIRTLMMIMMVY